MDTIEESKNKIKEFIKNNKVYELKEYINNNNISLETLNNSYFDLLLYSIEEKGSLDLINYIISKCQCKNFNYSIKNANKVKIPLCQAIDTLNYEVAKLFVNDESINFLLVNNCLTKKYLNFILTNGFPVTSITSYIIYQLISNSQDDLLTLIFKHYIFNNSFIIDLINLSKKKTPLSSDKFKKLIENEKSKITINEEMYRRASDNNNYALLKLFFEYDGNDEEIILERIDKYNLLEKAIQYNNYIFVKNILRRVDYYNVNYLISENILFSAVNNSDMSLDIIELLIEAILNTLIIHNKMNISSINTEYKCDNLSNNKEEVNVKEEKSDIGKEDEKEDKKEEKENYKDLIKPNIITLNLNYILNNIIKSMNLFQYLIKNKNDIDIHQNDDLKSIITLYLNYILNIVIKSKNLDFVQYLIKNKKDIDINSMDINHDYPLIVSIYCGTPAIFNFLLENGANVNIKDNNGNSILNIALNKPSYLKYLFSKKSINININEKDVSGNYPLMTAIYKNDINSVKSIVRYGTTHGEDMSNILNNNGYTPLILAYKLKYKVVFGCLLRYLDVNAKDLNKNTILYYAIMEEDVTTVSDLIKYGANVNFIDKNGNTPLHLAIYKKNKQIILNLLNSSHNLLLNVPNNQNDIPLVYLIKSLNVYTNDYKEIISLLIKKGTNVNYIDKKGNTPLVYAIKKNFVSVVELLINNGANVNHYIIERDESPLMYAIGLNSISMVKCLVNHNADTNFKNSKNKTVLMKASLTNLEIYNCVSNNNINNY